MPEPLTDIVRSKVEAVRANLTHGQPARWNAIVQTIMNQTARDRIWAAARAAETWPDKYTAFTAAP